MSMTKIEWTDETWNPTAGCDKVSGGCKGCYAIPHAHRLAGNPNPKISDLYKGLTVRQGGITNWTGEVRLAEHRLGEPLHWREPKKIFVNSMSDLFHEGLSDEAIDRVFAVMALCPQHTFQVLTKRPERMLEWFGRKNWSADVAGTCIEFETAVCDEPGSGGFGRQFWMHSHMADPFTDAKPWPLPNVWLGVSVEDQTTADERIPLLLQTPAAVRFVSYEPALGPVEFARYLQQQWKWRDSDQDRVDVSRPLPRLDWIICGGESGPGARPFDIDWARSTIAQCRASGVACFVKQLGAKPMYRAHGNKDPRHLFNGLQLLHSNGFPLKDRKGGNWDEWPVDMRVREFPQLSTSNSPARL